MRRLICTVLIFTVLFTLTACGNGQSEKNPHSQTESSTPLSTQSDAETEESKQPEPKTEESKQPQPETEESQTYENETNKEENGEMKMSVQVGSSTFTAVLENNAAVDALVEMMEKEPVVISMSDYSGFEKVGALGRSLPTSNSRLTTQSGDIVLYQGNQIVIFYGSNSWSYTRIGRIDNLDGWEEALGSQDVTVTFSLNKAE